MNDPKYFDNPVQLSDVDLSEKQTGKELKFTSSIAMIDAPKVYVYSNNSLIKTFEVDDGIELSNLNKDFKLTVSGSDFPKSLYGSYTLTLVLVYEIFETGNRDLKRNLILKRHSQ